MENYIEEKASHMKGRIAGLCGYLGHLSEREYLVEPNCIDGIKDLIRLLKLDDALHTSRRCMGEINIVENHLVHIIKNSPPDETDLFSICLRLLVNLTTPAILLYGEIIPEDKLNRHIYLSLIGHDQRYKLAFSDVELWNKIGCKLTNLLETEWTDRSADDGLEIERIFTLIRNVLQVPVDVEDQEAPSDVTVHDKVLMALREAQILELLLLMVSNENEEAFYLNILEILSHLLREQNPKMLARYEAQETEQEISEVTQDLLRARELRKNYQKKFTNVRNFNPTFVMRGVKSASNMDMIYHKSLSSLKNVDLNELQSKGRSKMKIPMDNNFEIRSNPSVKLFLKEFCLEFVNSSFVRFMNAVKYRIDSGKSLTHDRTYYFWAINFFIRFIKEANLEVATVQPFLSVESFHFIYTNIEVAFEHLGTEKKASADWVMRIHTILRAYQSLLEAILWLDSSKQPMVRAASREIKSEVFYVVEYRELTLYLLRQYDPLKFSISYLRDLIETSHLFLKLLEEFTKQTKLVVQKITRKRKTAKKRRKKEVKLTEEKKREKWDKIKEDINDALLFQISFPEISPFDATLDIPIDNQKERAMKFIQKFLHDGRFKDAIGFLRCSRQVWPENDYFGSNDMSPEEESKALEEICLADLEPLNDNEKGGKLAEDESEVDAGDENEANEDEGYTKITEQEFNILDYKQRLVTPKVVEICQILLKNYMKNSDHVNHCAVKLLHRIGWECNMPAILYQLSLFCTLLVILNEPSQRYNEIKTFALNLMRKFRKHAAGRPMVFVELLFWKSSGIALEIQHGYEPNVPTKKTRTKKKSTRKKKGKQVDMFIDNIEDHHEPSGKMDEVSLPSEQEDQNDIENLSSEESSDSEMLNIVPKATKKKETLHQNGSVDPIVDEHSTSPRSLNEKIDSQGSPNGLNTSQSTLIKSNRVTHKRSKFMKISIESDSGTSDDENISPGTMSKVEEKGSANSECEGAEEVDHILPIKRGREVLKPLSDSSDEASSIRKLPKSKRPKFIDSDSDEESTKPEEEHSSTEKRRRPKSTTIDSDSD